MRHAIAVDGGNPKTDVAIVREDGEVGAIARGGGSSPHHLGLEGALAVIEGLVEQARADARVQLPAAVAELLLAGVDFPVEEEAARRAIEQRGWATRVSVDNDTFAVLRAGTDARWGVAVVCGAGMNCVGVAPDGRRARFAALGWTSGDWGGGADVGREAVSAAARSEDGRGPKSVLERDVPAYFGVSSPSELAEAMHFGRIDESRAMELAPVVFAAAADDPIARSIVDRLVDEVVALARVAITRLGLERDAGRRPARRWAPAARRSPSDRGDRARARAGRACDRGACDDCAADPRSRAARARRARSAVRGIRSCPHQLGGRGRRARRRRRRRGWLTSASSMRPASIPGRRRRPSTAWTCTSRTASSSCSSARRAGARPRRCACSPVSRRSPQARS